MRKIMQVGLTLLSFTTMLALATSCSHAPPVKTEAYAKLPSERTFEYEFPVVWKGIESSLEKYKVVDRDPSEVDELEMKKLKGRSLETDWIYSQSRDKYQTYQVNGLPRRQALQARYKFKIEAKSVMGGTHVKVKTSEELERLNSDGSSAGYDSISPADPSRANDILSRIDNAILSAAP